MSPNGRVISNTENPWTPSRPRPLPRPRKKIPSPSSNPLPAGPMTRLLLPPTQRLTLANLSFPALNPSQTTSSLPHAPMSALFRTPGSPSQYLRTPFAGAAELCRKWNLRISVYAPKDPKASNFIEFYKNGASRRSPAPIRQLPVEAPVPPDFLLRAASGDHGWGSHSLSQVPFLKTELYADSQARHMLGRSRPG
jgi:hypothetical protein